MIQRLHRLGSLTRVVRGLYLVSHTHLDQRRLQRCAAMLAGPRGGLTGRSALEAWSVLRPQTGRVAAFTASPRSARRHVTEARFRDGGRGLVRLERPVHPPPLTVHSGLPLACVPAALVDLAGSADAALLEGAWREAEFRGLLDQHALYAEVARTQRPGVGAVRSLVERRRILTDSTTDLRSRGELPFLHLIAQAGLELPEVNVPMQLGGRHYVADYFYRWLGLVVELDTPDHLQPAAGARDRLRDVDFFIAGLDVIRFLESEVALDPGAAMAALGAAIARQRRRVGQAA